MPDPHAPRRAVRLRTDRTNVAAEIHEAMSHSVLEADGRDPIGRVFLADAAEVDLHARTRQADRLRGPLDLGPADERDGRRRAPRASEARAGRAGNPTLGAARPM
jgi:hypothetical protein